LNRDDLRWESVELDVADDDGGHIPARPIELYTLADPERTIDGTALLREREIADPPYWALVWTGARAIAAFLETFALPARANVLDLGCGLGLAGFAAARLGTNVTFADYLEEPLDIVRASLARHDVDGCSVQRIDFTKHAAGSFDAILAADIVYDPVHYGPLAEFLDGSLSRIPYAGAALPQTFEPAVLLTESLRADAAVFLELMRERGFCDQKRALWVQEDGRRERTWLHVLRRAR
jgi:predicted nicotinamide N-methyase